MVVNTAETECPIDVFIRFFDFVLSLMCVLGLRGWSDSYLNLFTSGERLKLFLTVENK